MSKKLKATPHPGSQYPELLFLGMKDFQDFYGLGKDIGKPVKAPTYKKDEVTPWQGIDLSLSSEKFGQLIDYLYEGQQEFHFVKQELQEAGLTND